MRHELLSRSCCKLAVSVQDWWMPVMQCGHFTGALYPNRPKCSSTEMARLGIGRCFGGALMAGHAARPQLGRTMGRAAGGFNAWFPCNRAAYPARPEPALRPTAEAGAGSRAAPQQEGGNIIRPQAQLSQRAASGPEPVLLSSGPIRSSSRGVRKKGWCRGADSNCRHLHFQCSALPTELPRRLSHSIHARQQRASAARP